MTRILALTLASLLAVVFPAAAQPADGPGAEPTPDVTDDEGDAAAAKPPTKKPAPEPDPVAELPSWDDVSAGEGLANTPGNDLAANWDAAAGPEAEVSFPWIEHHGYFRVRGDLLYNLDLGTYDLESRTGSSPVLPPLTEVDTEGPQHPETREGATFGRDADSLSGANMRFRYAPTIHISESLRVRTTLDIFDNMVLGSTPGSGPGARLARPDLELAFFDETQLSPSDGSTSYRDAIRVKHAWAEWRTPLGLLSAGRMSNHWGLGMVANGGECIDCDFGDSIDRVMGVTKLFDTYVAFAWDFPSEGPVGMSGTHTLFTQQQGQAYDLDQRDDVNQWVVALFQKPYGLEEKEQRARDLAELGKPVFDWGVYNIIRSQSLESIYDGDGLPEGPGDFQLREINAFSYTPDLWLDFQYRPTVASGVRVQLEAAAVFGSIEELPNKFAEPAQQCTDPTVVDLDDCGNIFEPRYRDIFRLGYALEIDARYNALNYGLHHGLASGDDQEGFGYLDRGRLDTDGVDKRLTAFRFDRDYHVDLILFRELIGGVTNAVYFKPYIGYDLVDESDEAWGFQLSAMYAFALEADQTPGNESPLGIEFDIELYIHEFNRFRLSMAYGVLFPLEAFDMRLERALGNGQRSTTVLDPDVAQTVQLFLGVEF